MDFLPAQTQTVLFIRAQSNQKLLTKMLYQATGNQEASEFIVNNSDSIFTAFHYRQEQGVVIDSILLGDFQPLHLNWVFARDPLWQKKESRIGWYQLKEGGLQIAAPFQKGLYLTTDSQKNLFESLVQAEVLPIENKKNDQLLEHDITLQVRDIFFVDKLLLSFIEKQRTSPSVSSFLSDRIFASFFSPFLREEQNGLLLPFSLSALPLRSLSLFFDRIETDYRLGLQLEFRTKKEALTSRALLLTMINRFLLQNGYQSTLINKDIQATIDENVLTLQGLILSEESLIVKMLGEKVSP